MSDYNMEVQINFGVARKINAKFRTKKQMTTRRFRIDTQTHQHLHKNDLVLVLVPEDMEILCSVPACAHGHMGHIISDVNDENEEVQVALRETKLTKRTDSFRSVERCKGEIVSIPKFCLCLEESVLASRLSR